MNFKSMNYMNYWTKEQLENERNTQKIEHLNSERIKQDLELENKEIEHNIYHHWKSIRQPAG